MKFCLIHPPNPFLITDRVFPSLGILYVAAVIRNSGHEVKVFDCAGLSVEQWKEELSNIKADVYGITSTSPQYNYAKKIASFIKTTHPKALRVIGGPHPSCGNELNHRCFDISFSGDGEKSITKFWDTDFKKTDYIHGELVDRMDDIPFPARDLIDIHDYTYKINGIPATTMITSRGCPYSCAFCCHLEQNKGVRLHSAEYVIEEIKEIQKIGFKAIMFFDDIFILNKTRLFKICDYIKSQNIIFRCFVRSDIGTPEILDYLKKSGCCEIGIGIESGSPRILANIDKNASLEEHRAIIAHCHKINLRAKIFIIIGLPGETKETIGETEKFIEETKPDDIDFSVLSVFRGTKIHNNPEKYDVKFDSIGDFWKGTPGQYKAHVRTSALSQKDILKERERLEKKFKRKELLK